MFRLRKAVWFDGRLIPAGAEVGDDAEESVRAFLSSLPELVVEDVGQASSPAEVVAGDDANQGSPPADTQASPPGEADAVSLPESGEDVSQEPSQAELEASSSKGTKRKRNRGKRK
jgi:hypothetical protein